MIDIELLKTKIKESGLKKEYISEKLNISMSSLSNKLNGRYPFSVNQMYQVQDILKLNDKETKDIFFTDNVDKTETNKGG